MKKSMDIARLVIFIVVGIGLYIYMGNAFAAQVSEPKSIIEMTANRSYAIWRVIDRIEDPWYVSEPPESLEIAPLKEEKIKKLRDLVSGYEDLMPLAEALIEARQQGDLETFRAQRKKVMKILRPIWRQDVLEEQERRRKMGWVAWIKERLTQAMNRLYAYLFSSKPAEAKVKFVGKVDEKTGQYTVISVPK